MKKKDYETIMDAFEITIKGTEEIGAFRDFRHRMWGHFQSCSTDDLMISLSMAYLEGLEGAGVSVEGNGLGVQPTKEELN